MNLFKNSNWYTSFPEELKNQLKVIHKGTIPKLACWSSLGFIPSTRVTAICASGLCKLFISPPSSTNQRLPRLSLF